VRSILLFSSIQCVGFFTESFLTGEREFTGHPMYGQLGNGTNGEFIERAGSISYHFETGGI
jgi:hypothetical protein